MESPFQNFEFEQIYNSSPGSSSAFKAAPSTPDSNFSAASNSSFYSSSGFDIISILSQLHKRPKKKIELGPVDHSCAFLLSDAQHRDFPIIYASPNFEKLTGYTFDEIKGRNCRFLQSPDGIVESGSIRKHTDNWAVKQLKFQTIDGDEQQVSLINYKKNGEPFVNLVTVIPIIEEGIVRFYLGLQVDMIEQPGAILNKMTNGTYAINYSNMSIPTSITSSVGLDLDNTSLQLLNLSNATPNSLNSNLAFKFKDRQALNSGNTGFINWHQMLVDQCDNLVHILSLRGVMLYASKSCETLLGYSSSKLQNRPLSEICHPADINPVLREIKSCSESQDLFSLIYRLKHIDGSFIWFETFGKIHTDSSTSRKCIILSAKPIKMPQLPSIWAHILGGLSDSDFWWRMTSEGLVLSATSGMESNLGSQYKDCIGTSLYQLIHPDSCLPLTACLEACKTGRVSGLRYFTVGLGCKISEIESIFYPSGTSPSHIMVKCRLVKEETDRRLPAPNVSYPLSDGLAINFNPPYLFGELLPSHDRTMKYEVHRLKNDNARLRDELKRYEANESSLPPAKIQRSDPTQNLQCPQCRQYSVTRSLALDGSKIDMCTCGWQCIS